MYGNPVRLHRCPECRTPHEGEGLCPACAAQWEGEVEAIVAAPEAGRREARDPGHYEPRFRNPPGDYSHRHGNPVPPSHAVHGWAKLNRISREMTGRDYRDLPDDGPEQDAVMRAYERDEDAMAAEYGRHGNPAGGMFHIVAKNDRTGREYLLTGAPVTHQEGVTIMSKQSRPARDVRIMLVPAGGARHGNPTWSRDRREQFDRARREEAQGTLATDEELAEALGDLEVPPNASVSLYHTPVGDRFRVYAGNRLHETSLLRHELPAAFAAIEAEGDERHGNPVHPSARERGFARHGEGQERMTIARAREILTPLGIVIKRTDPYEDEWRVNFRGGTESTATYESSIPSAVATGQAMAADRARHGNPLY